MSHRQKGEHKSRHRTHAIKPQSQIQPTLAPMVPVVVATVGNHVKPKAATIASDNTPTT